MQLPPLQPINNSQSFVSGDVTIDPSAAIAPGVVITAEPNSRIIIGAGVCIGMGSILQVGNGILEIEAGAVLGAGVLAIGECKIGANACIGSATTIFNTSVEPKRQVSPGSILGDNSRRILAAPTVEAKAKSATTSIGKNTSLPIIRILPCTDTDRVSETPAPNVVEPDTAPVRDRDSANQSSPPPTEPSPPTPSPVESSQFNPAQAIYGQVHLNRLMVTLFPHKNSLKRPYQDGKAE